MARAGRWLVMLLMMTTLACGRSASAPKKQEPPSPSGLIPVFLEDDYPGARAEALRKDVPLFVDVWAGWCHTCMSMKEFVLRDPALGALSSSFVWLSIDSERADNAAFLERFKNTSLPTLWVIEPRSEQPLLKWIGAATVTELVALLEGAARDRLQAGDAPAADAGDAALAALRLAGDRQSAAGQGAQAIELYRRALARSSPSWSQRPTVVEALSMRLSEAHRAVECVELAAREAASMPKGTALVNLLVNALSAVDELPKDGSARAEMPGLVERARALVADPALQVLVDDRSSLYMTLVDTLAGTDPAGAQRLAADWAKLLEAEAEAAPTKAARRVWDPHRLEAYLALHQPERALPMLEQSERELPDDYNAPARLARARLVLGHNEQARSAIDRAIARCPGPRKLRLYLVKADVLVAAQDRDGARAALDEALAFARSTKLSARYEAVRVLIERRLSELS